MTSVQNIGFAIPNFDWDAYVKIRPTYPDSLFSRIYDYHKQHCDCWTVVHDAGSGAGIAAAVLAQRFNTVVVSDPNAEYLQVAKERLAKWNAGTPKFVFRHSSAEDQSWLEPESLDMFTIFTAVMYTDPDVLMRELSRVLKPRATFAAVTYNGWPALIDNEAAAAAWMAYGDLWVTKGIQDDCAPPVAVRAFRVGWPGHDSIALPEDVFENGALRVKINEKYRPETDQVKRLPGLGFSPSKVRDTDIVVEEEDFDHWMKSYTLPELKAFVNTLAYVPTGRDLDHLWQRIQHAMEQSKQETLTLLWSVHIVLATRREH